QAGSLGSDDPGRHALTGVLVVLAVTPKGVPASSPWNSANCHCRVSSHNGSWMRASSPGAGSPVTDCGSSRVHAGGVSATALSRGLIARTETALMVSLMHLLLHVSGDCVDRQRFPRNVADIERLFTLQRPA